LPEPKLEETVGEGEGEKETVVEEPAFSSLVFNLVVSLFL